MALLNRIYLLIGIGSLLVGGIIHTIYSDSIKVYYVRVNVNTHKEALEIKRVMEEAGYRHKITIEKVEIGGE